LLKIENDRWPEKDFESELDIYYCFFTKCYHLKDWLKETVAVNARSTVEDFVNNSVEISLCGDIVNASKHLLLDAGKRTRPKKLISILSDADGIALFREYDPSAGKRKYRIRIQTAEKRWDAIELARSSVNGWNSFIRTSFGVKFPLQT